MVLVQNGFPTFQYLAMFTATLNILCSGMFFGWSSPSLPKLLNTDSHIPITNDEGSWIAVMFLIGGICGSLLAGFLLDKIGRKNVILLTSFPFFIAWLMVAYVESVELLLIARFLAGISDGLIFCGNCMYLTEIADPKIRGFIGCSITVSSIFGILLINVIGSYLSIKTTALVSSVVPLILLMTFIWMPKSPYYLIMKGRTEEAKRSLQIFKGTKNVEAELNRLSEAIKEQNASNGNIFDLVTVKSNRRALYTMMGVRVTQQCSGAMAIAIYAQIIFEEAGDEISPVIASTIYFSIQLIVSIFSTSIVDRTGRKPLMIISMIGVCLVLLIEGSYFYIKNTTDIDTSSFTLVSIISLIIFVVMYSMGMQTIPLLLVGELFPTNVKAFAVSFSDIYFCVVTTIVSKFFQYTKDEFGLHVPFLAFAACSALGLIFIILFVPETKGKTLEEIQQELKGEKRQQKVIGER